MLLIPNFLLSLVRTLFFIIDWLIYNVFSGLYQIFIELSSKTVFSNEVISSFTSRVYVLVGIIMLFKMAFSLVNMFVNPDSFNDSNTGMGKLVQKAIIALVLLIATPIGFNYAYELQSKLVKANVIGKLLVGKENATIVEGDGHGAYIAANLYSAFFYPNENVDTNDITPFNEITDFGIILKNVNKTKDGEVGIEYQYSYWIILSTAAGIIMSLIMIQFILDVAIRMFKLAFLQLIAPVPIILSIDPKKDDQLKNWFQTTIKTYISLFLRIAIIYFVIYLLGILIQGGGLALYELDRETQSVSVSGWNALLYPIMYIGLFMFAKEFPKLLEEIFGIKLDGNFTLNPAKRMKDDMPGATRIASAAGGLTSRGIPGMLSAAWKNKGFKESVNDQANRRRNLQFARGAGSTRGGRFASSLAGTFGMDDELDRLNQQEKEIKNRQADGKNTQARNSRISDIVTKMEERAQSRITTGAAGKLSQEYEKRQAEEQSLKSRLDLANQRASRFAENDTSSAATVARSNVADLEKQLASTTATNKDWLQNAGTEEYIDKISSGSLFGADGKAVSDATLMGQIEKYTSEVQANGMKVNTTAHGRHEQGGSLRGDNNRIDIDNAKDNRTLEEIATQKERAQANRDAARW